MAQEFIYQMQGLRKVHPGGKEVLKNIWLSFFPGAKIGVLGSNGAGKSSLLRVMAGEDTEFFGEARLTKGFTRGYLPQEPKLDASKDVRGNVEEGVKATRALLERFDEVSNKLGEVTDDDEMNALLEEQATLQDQIDAVNAWELDRQLDIAMDALRCPPGDADVSKLSGGERRRVALCQLLLQKPDLLLLDEPTNHLDAESVYWLERFLQEYSGTVVAVTHDRYFLDNAAQWILELDRGEGIPWQGNYSSWLDQKKKRLEIEEKSNESRRKTLERELEWIQQSPRARQAKSKARIAAYEELRNQEAKAKDTAAEIIIPPGPRLGELVVELKNVTKSFGDRVLIDNLSFSLPRGAIVGIIGPNGAGKTTLFKLITGQEKPDTGTLRVGETVKISYVDQSRDTLDAQKSVFDVVSGGEEQLVVNGLKINTRAYTAQFGFKGTDQQKKVGVLSGGERNRVHLAKLVLSGGNLLLLDEPTNDIDVATLRNLEDAVLNFSGCVMVVSHDRWFLDRIATHILAFEDEGKVIFFEGNFQDYHADLKRRLGAEAEQPHRLRYKKLTR